MPDEPLIVHCSEHGRGRASVVCAHMLEASDRIVGFVENSADPDDLQAWCDDCERVFVEQNGMTDAFLAFNRMSVVCGDCYRRLKDRHSNVPA